MGRKIKFYNGGYFHIYNRGVDKRTTFKKHTDYLRFLDGMKFFNQENPIGSLYEYSFRSRKTEIKNTTPLVRIVAYNVLDNHFHFVLEQLQDGGVSKFMQKLIGGYTQFFNTTHHRTGPLFSSPFKASHIDTDGYFKKIQAYVHFNHLVHGLGTQGTKSSYTEFKFGKALNGENLCSSSHIIGEFGLLENYESYATELLSETIALRKFEKDIRRKSDLGKMLLE